MCTLQEPLEILVLLLSAIHLIICYCYYSLLFIIIIIWNSILCPTKQKKKKRKKKKDHNTTDDVKIVCLTVEVCLIEPKYEKQVSRP